MKKVLEVIKNENDILIAKTINEITKKIDNILSDNYGNVLGNYKLRVRYIPYKDGNLKEITVEIKSLY